VLDRDIDAQTVLAAVDLAALGQRLDEQGHWTQLLSLGEQQRLALARAFLLEPDWLFLDEATSALEEDQEAILYRRLADALPHTTLISIGHRRSLEAPPQTRDLGGLQARISRVAEDRTVVNCCRDPRRSASTYQASR
jgi:ABC-type uncharacterized transport system fused permease/ATPase subunit